MEFTCQRQLQNGAQMIYRLTKQILIKKRKKKLLLFLTSSLQLLTQLHIFKKMKKENLEVKHT